MKKKAIKIAASTAVAASAFVAAAPAQQADAAVNVNQLVSDAQNAGTVLKWAISVEGTADYKTQPMAQYNAAKKAIAAAEKAAASLSASEKLSVDAKLVEPKLQVKRAQAYIDAITSSVKIKELTANLDAAIKSNDIEKVEAAYHKATAEYRKQAALLDRVYGQSTRDGIRNEVKPAIEKLVASVKNEVTVSMLAKAAAADVKADKLEDASKKIAEAQAILDANVLTWEAALQKSVDDVATSLPLVAVSVTYVDANTVQVKLSKKVDAVNLSQFTSSGLVINSVSLGDDKRTVTLTTGTQTAGKTYTIAFNGKEISYTVPTSANGSTITSNGTAIFAEVDGNVVVTTTFKEKTGQAYTGLVRVTAPAGTKFVSINGSTANAGLTTADVTPTQSGVITLVLTASASVDAEQVKFEKLHNGDVTETGYSAEISFYVTADPTVVGTTFTAATEVLYVDAKNKYFVIKNAGGELVRYTVKAGDAFVNESTSGLTLDQFFAALNTGDQVIVPAYGTGNSASQFNITFNKVITDFKFASKYSVKKNETATGTVAVPGAPLGAYRVDTTNKFAVEGTGHAGYTVYVQANGGTLYTTTVKANGTWSVDVNLDQNNLSSFGAFQLPAGTNPAGYAGTVSVLNVFEGAYDIEGLSISGTTTGDSLLGKVITLTDTPSINDTAVVKAGATITLVDEDGTKVRYTNGKNATFTKVSDSVVTITVTGAYATVAAGSTAGFGSAFTVESIVGVTNSYGMDAKVDSTLVLAK